MAEHDGDPVPGHPGIAGLVPFRLEASGARHVREIARVAWENRDEAAYAASLLRWGVCDACALGPRGLTDDAAGGLHLCGERLRRLRADTIGPLAPVDLADIERLRGLTDGELAALGRIPYPFVRRAGGRGFARASWEEALALVGGIVAATPPGRQAWLAGAQDLSNEAWYAFARAARSLGVGNLDFCAPPVRVGAGLAPALGTTASTCSLSDLIGADLVLLWRTDLAVEQPVALKYLHLAKERGARVVVIDAALDPGLAAAWIPTIPRSALFGTRIADDVVTLPVGSDQALADAILALLARWGAVDRGFIDAHTTGWPAREASLAATDAPDALALAGVRPNEVEWLARLIARSRRMVTVFGERAARAAAGIAQLHLARGALGRPQSGILPMPRLAGRLGGADCGIASSALSAGQAIEAARRGEIDVLYTLSGDLYATGAEPTSVVAAAARARLRVHQGTAVDASALLDPGEIVVLLPAQTRHEQRGGGTITSVERRIRFSPEIARRAVGEARAAWEIPALVAAAANPALGAPWSTVQEVREEIAREIPRYAAIRTLREAGDWAQWGGPQLFADGRFDGLPGGKARFVP